MGAQSQVLLSYGATSLIKSIQNVSVTIAGSSATGTATITSVNTANTALFYGGQQVSGQNNFDGQYASIDLTNATTLTATRNISQSTTVTVWVTVVEFQSSAVKSIQYGTASTGAAASGTATITSVTTTNSAIIFNGQVCQVASSSAMSSCLVHGVLTNATTVTATRGASSGSAVILHFCVLEFNSGILNSSTQAATIQIASAGTSNTATITSVTTSQTATMYGGLITSNGSGAGNVYAYAQLTNGTTLTVTRNSNAAVTTTVPVTVMEFKAANVNSLNRAKTTIASSASSQTATITAVNTSLTAISHLGMSDSAAGTAIGDNLGDASLTNATTVTMARGTSNTNSLDNSWEAIEFK
jgi:hypothetical protein